MPWELNEKIALAHEDVYTNWIFDAGSFDFFRFGEGQVPYLRREEARGGRLLADRRPPTYEVQFFPLDDRGATLRKIREEVANSPPDELIRVTFGPPLRARSFAGSRAASARGPRTPPAARKFSRCAVVVGVIDDGIAFAHERFRNPGNTSRVEYVWLQDGDYGGPPDLPYGREIAKAGGHGVKGIDSLLADCTHAGSVDEDELYRCAGALGFGPDDRGALARRAAHGTHVMDLACGYDPGKAPERPIVAVQLPVATTARLS